MAFLATSPLKEAVETLAKHHDHVASVAREPGVERLGAKLPHVELRERDGLDGKIGHE